MNIVITGASKGIGREVAIEFSKDPENNILAISRSGEDLKSLIEKAEHENIEYYIADIITESKRPEMLLKHLKNAFGGVDILINNAGAIVPGKFEKSTEADEYLVIETNFIAPMRLIKNLLPLIPSNGHVINISSMSGFQGSSKYPGLAVYAASKAAIAVLTESLAKEYEDVGPSFNSLSLGAVQTEMLAKAFPGFKAPLMPEEMAKFICWFAIEGSKYFNGKNLPVTVGNP